MIQLLKSTSILELVSKAIQTELVIRNEDSAQRLLHQIEITIESNKTELAKASDPRAIVELLGFDPTNHHNAKKCPYCKLQDV